MLSGDDYKSQRLCVFSVLTCDPVFTQSGAVMAICDDFDMIRLFDPQQVTVEDVVKYGVLEHLVRATTEDVTMYEEMLTDSVAGKISDIVSAKREMLQEAMRDLEAVITVSDLQELPDLPSFVTIYQIGASGDVNQIEIDPEEAGQWPIVVCIDTSDFIGLLYNPVETCVDGYNAMSGANIYPILSDTMLREFGLRLRLRSKRRSEEGAASVSTQTKPSRRAQRLTFTRAKLEVIEMPKRTQGQCEAVPVDSVRRISIEPVQSIAIAAERPTPKSIVMYKPRRAKASEAPRVAKKPAYSSFLETKQPTWTQSADVAKEISRSRENCGIADGCQVW